MSLRICQAGLGLYFLTFIFISGAVAQTGDFSGQTDDSIRYVLRLIAHHQMTSPLTDGDYPLVNSLPAATNATPPAGIQWMYPWGVTLYGMLKFTDAAGDKDIESYVLTHNLIAG